MDAFRAYAEKIGLPVIIDEEYQIEEYLRNVAFREGERCRICYSIRLREAAQIARKGKFTAFTTTLLVSPFQKHELIKEIGTAIGAEVGVPFYYVDFREGYKGGVIRSKEEGMYRQQYCGCIYSERDRYKSHNSTKNRTKTPTNESNITY